MKLAKHSQLNLAQRIVLSGLLLCMVLAQSLSFAHRTLHHDVRMLAHAYEEQHADHHGHGADCDHGIFSRLFSGHEEGDETCRVIDGSHGSSDVFSPVADMLPALHAHILVASVAYSLAAWQAPLFEARGPPAHSL
ncbi:hypothetical protein [Variovorax sp. PCZ-1]|uniref:hypothetical protein n=1 Tax=Variovorax sp. PCZ-1 TaxID=2835533 RepID=UPI001BCF37C2|nr:hypothetical protein [Variovorax sp. PCZ-1]MBS7808347.1 hypothetical protein [Variovorax sp. PCZ-1]